MGRQARLKRERREGRLMVEEGSRSGDTPLRILRGIHRTIQGHCGENSRRCWEYMLEMLAHSTGWQTESSEAKHLWDKMANETRWTEFYQAWIEEVQWAKRNGAPFSEPLGQLLEEIEGTNDYLGQFFTPMQVVRMMNAINFADSADLEPRADGTPSHRGLDPCCGTGRFIIDALVHNDGILMHGVDLDLWLLRTAMLNVRMLAPWTTLRMKDPDDRLKPLHRARRLIDRMEQLNTLNPFARAEDLEKAEPRSDEGGDVLLIGGRAIFMHGNSLVVDLNYTPNWLCAGWAWSPRQWTSNLKIDGFYGTYDEWITAGKPPLGDQPAGEQVQFDYSMRDKQPQPRPSPP